ncbi:MAG: polysaccharide pyruvyl transferase family protein [Chlorobiaceae bacterium]|nr:polysaccharide pyruvyl transferase family protein [Chlorobiaceae bacterium]
MMIAEKKSFAIGIITRRAGYNFGSSLQAYAIQRVIEKLGYSALILDYDETSKNPLWRVRPFLDDSAYRFMNSVPMLSRRLFSTKHKELCDRDAQISKFSAFEKSHLKLTPKTYRSSRKLASAVSDCDICICGSDQIWSPLLFDPTMFLDFCRKIPVKTVSYAPSFGVGEINTHRDEIRELLNNIDIISVRENEGADIIRELTGRDVPVVLDPTLLLDVDDWRAIAEPSGRKTPYILCYFLGEKRIPYRFLSEFSRHTGYELFNVSTFRNRNDIPGDSARTFSPQEFVGAVADAAFVCTDSFHGTIFSILFERRFMTFERFGSERHGQNSRIHTLLDHMNLNARLIPFDQGYCSNAQAIDYEVVRPSLNRNRETSLNFLKAALESK